MGLVQRAQILSEAREKSKNENVLNGVDAGNGLSRLTRVHSFSSPGVNRTKFKGLSILLPLYAFLTSYLSIRLVHPTPQPFLRVGVGAFRVALPSGQV